MQGVGHAGYHLVKHLAKNGAHVTIADINTAAVKKCVEDLLQVRKAYIDYFMHNNRYQTSDQFWHNYFLIFNYMAALEKGK